MLGTVIHGGPYLTLLLLASSVLHSDSCTTGCEAQMNFDVESVCLLADNVQNELVSNSQITESSENGGLLHKTFIEPMEGVLIYTLGLFCRNICNF
jgi:hypothetical protein